MKKICLLFILLFIPVMVYAEELNLAENAKSAIMIEASTGKILYSKNPHEKLAPASMTKIMSLILIMENIESGNIKWDDTVVASANASSMGGSQIFLKTGEVMKVEDLIKAICVASANDAVVAMAEKIAGTEEEFVKLMNDKARSLGAKNTNFKNSTGLDIEGHYSTAYDMAIMARELIRHQKILEFSSIYEDYLRKGTENSFWLVNTNKLVRYYDYIDGLKTGFTDNALYCLTATGKKNGMRLITVVMREDNTNNRTKDTIAMMDYGFNMYSINNIVSKDKVLGTIDVNLGVQEKVEIVPVKDVNQVNKKQATEKKITYEMKLDNVNAPVKKGDIVGELEIYENNKYLETVDITVKEDVKKASIPLIFIRNLRDVLVG